MTLYCCIIFFSFFSSIIISGAASNDYQLELLQVLFRHGDRTPDKVEIYKNDPYEPHEYVDPGYGQLTKIGKYRSYKLGQVLRQRYDSFLGDYRYNKVYGYSTDKDRTKMSLQLVLAGLYPPTLNTSWSNDINWLPIPVHYDSNEKNFLVKNILGFCPIYQTLVNEAFKTPEIKKKYENYNEFYQYLENATGVIMTNPDRPIILHNNVRAIQSMGLPRPNWCSEDDFKKLQEITSLSYDVHCFTEKLNRISSGPLLKKLLENIRDNNQSNDDGRKIYLYSGLDLNVGMFTRAHNFKDIPFPDYGSAVIIEKLKGKDNEIYIRMLLWTGVTEKLIPIKFEKLDAVLSLKDYMDYVSPLMPRPDDCLIDF